jgi:hypothetical protein
VGWRYVAGANLTLAGPPKHGERPLGVSAWQQFGARVFFLAPITLDGCDLVVFVLTPLTSVDCSCIAKILEGLSHVDAYAKLVTDQLGDDPVHGRQILGMKNSSLRMKCNAVEVLDYHLLERC